MEFVDVIEEGRWRKCEKNVFEVVNEIDDYRIIDGGNEMDLMLNGKY